MALRKSNPNSARARRKESSGGSSTQKGLTSAQTSSLQLSGGLTPSNIRSVASAFGTTNKAPSAIRHVASINSSALSNNGQVQLPEKTFGENQMPTIMGNNQGLAKPSMGFVLNASGGLDYTPPTETGAVATVPDQATSNFQSYLNSIQGIKAAMPSATDTFNRLEKQSGLKQAEQDVQNYTSQLNTITSNAQAQSLSLEGQGRGQTGSFVGGEQARISREAAIQALPIQALLANAQGNKELAQAHLDTRFKLEMQDAQSQYDYNIKVVGAVYEFASTQEKRRLDEMAQEKANEFTLKRDEAQFTRDKYMAQMGINADMAMFNAKLAAENKATAISPLSLANRESSINQLDGLARPSAGMSSAVGTSYLTRSTGFWGSVGKVFTGLLTGAGAGAAAGSVIPGAGTLAGGVVGGIIGAGVSATTLAKQTFSKLSGSEQSFIGGVSQIVGQLTVDKLAQAKGAGVTFGALSDGERGLIAESASLIKSYEIREKGNADGKVIGYNASQKAMQLELNKINNFKRLDYVLQGGSPEAVGVQVVGSEYQFRNPDGTISILYRQ